MVLDLSALQTLVAAVELGGFGKAAVRLHRSPGAVSLQIKALEERVGTELFRKTGRQQTLTDAGELLLGYARRLLALNDDAVLALQGMGMEGDVRFGMPQDFADSWLPPALAQFTRTHPLVRIGITVDRSPVLLSRLHGGELDLVLAFGDTSTPASEMLARMPVQWIAHPDLLLSPDEPVPLLVLDQPCGFRESAIQALDRAGRPWRIMLTSASVSAIWAAARAGLGVTARTAIHIPQGLVIVGDALALPKLRAVTTSLHWDSMASKPAVAHLRSVVEETARQHLSSFGVRPLSDSGKVPRASDPPA